MRIILRSIYLIEGGEVIIEVLDIDTDSVSAAEPGVAAVGHLSKSTLTLLYTGCF